MTYTSYQEQMEYLEFVAMRDYDAKPREIHIREMAAEVIKQAETYSPTGWTVIVRYDQRRRNSFHGYREGDALPLPNDSTYSARYKQINVRLVPEAQGSPYVAQLLAEQQLRTEWP